MNFSCLSCRAAYPLSENIHTCPKCGGLLDVLYDFPAAKPAQGAGSQTGAGAPAGRRSASVAGLPASASSAGFGPAKSWPELWRGRRASLEPADLSGVWRFRELIPFLDDPRLITTLGEGNTPLITSAGAARYAGLERLRFKHQGFNPTGSFKDNGMVTGVARARSLGMRLVACVSTGNTSASMAAYSAAAGLRAVVFVPRGEIALGKLAQALEFGAVTLEVEGNFDVILKLVFELAPSLGLYLLNSVNPFRLEGQKTIMAELLEQCAWQPPDWIVVPGGNLGNVSAFGKGLRELHGLGLISRLPRLAVVQAEGAAPLYRMLRDAAGTLTPVDHPETLATAIKIGAPVSWPKAVRELKATSGVCEIASEQEIADAKAVIGRAGIGCEPASAATLAGIKKLVAGGVISPSADVVAVLTGHLLKDPEYILQYHTGKLSAGGRPLTGAYANQPRPVAANAASLRAALESLRD